MRQKNPRTVVLPSAEQAAALVKKVRGDVDSKENYRSKSIRLHGAICAK